MHKPNIAEINQKISRSAFYQFHDCVCLCGQLNLSKTCLSQGEAYFQIIMGNNRHLKVTFERAVFNPL